MSGGRRGRRRIGQQLDAAQRRAGAPQVSFLADGDDAVRHIGGKSRRDMTELRGKVLVEEKDVHRGTSSSMCAGCDLEPSIVDEPFRVRDDRIGSRAGMAWPPPSRSSC
jgi:hypothetical protein